MSHRIQLANQVPAAVSAMMGLESYLGGTDIPLSLKELIKLRASMINGCAYCIEMHADVAMKHGESAQRLLALAAWQESPLFDARERAVLALTDEVTLIADKGLTTQTYEAALAQLGETLLAQCLVQVVTINAWNRIAVATRMEHDPLLTPTPREGEKTIVNGPAQGPVLLRSVPSGAGVATVVGGREVNHTFV